MPFIDHLTINVTDYDKSKRFYELALAALGAKPIKEWGRACGFGVSKPDFWIAEGAASFQKPEQLARITPMHVAFVASTRSQVDAFYAAAIAAGAKDNGAPGLRPHYHAHYYGAFVIDPDGHNVEAVFHAG